MLNQYRLTTIDNPFDPFEEEVVWRKFDVLKGYNSDQLLARIAKISDDMTEIEEDAEVQRAIDEIILQDPFNIYKKVARKQVETTNT